ncbi:hypothetical protein BDQ17DRAFT_1262280, partial [Cyathus striatus]
LELDELEPTEYRTYHALCILGEMLDALITLFISTDWSISQQITSIAKFAFILGSTFIENSAAFMKAHLYGDLQCFVRNSVNIVAHTKELDPQHLIFLCLIGTDILEILFGCVRMIGGHSPNVAPDEFCHHAASATRLHHIFEQYPEWEHKPC